MAHTKVYYKNPGSLGSEFFANCFAAEVLKEHQLIENTKKYMSAIVEGIGSNIKDIENKISENLKKDWKIERISKINFFYIINKSIYIIFNYSNCITFIFVINS